MLYTKPRVLPAGDAAILVELADEISAEASARVYALAAALDAARWPGLGEAVPAYAALLVAYDPRRWAYAALAARLASLAGDAATSAAPAGPVVDIPVHYGGEDGPDLADLAARRGLTPAQVVALHSGTIYTVYMLGFTPGFAYLGTVPEGIATPRLATPRTRVPAGSVGIAGRQTGIYPQSTPGGWRLIGRTNAVLFDPRREPPSLLGPHDQVRFVPVNDLPPLPPPRLVERKQSRRAKEEIESAASGGENQLAILRGMGEVHALPPGAERPLLQVITPGWLTTVQDLGRPGYQRFGVPVSGAVDREALAAANALVGNPAGAAALEITLGGLTLHVLADTRAAITGADLDAVLQRGNFGPWEAPLWTDLYLRRDTVLEFRAARRGCRAYLALPGGVAVPTAMGSAATYLAGGFGGLEGRVLRGGDVIAAGPDLAGAATACLGGVAVAVEDRPAYSAEPVVRIIPGPHDDYFTPEALAVLTSGVYHVSPASDRMGLRLTGPRLARRDSRELISCGTVLGGLQVPPDGQPIVLLADRQTVGGYPIIATVVCADIPLLAQCVPGQARVRFVPVTVEAAQAAGREYYAAMTPRDLTSEVLGF